jgi:hypothetical protein
MNRGSVGKQIKYKSGGKMGILTKLAKGPKLTRNINPLAAGLNAKKHGGSPLKAILDPMQHILKSGPRSAAQADKAYGKSPEGREKKRRTEMYAGTGLTDPMRMSKGGQICKGAGKATRGRAFGRGR